MNSTFASNLIRALNVTADDDTVLIQEHGLADGNFVITYLINQVLKDPSNKICLVILHNTLGHYCNVGKKLSCDRLVSSIRHRIVKVIDPMTSIYNNLVANKPFDKNPLVALDAEIKSTIKEFQKDIDEYGGKVYVIVDDLSHLFDLGADLNSVLRFLNSLNRDAFEKGLKLIVNTHVGEEYDNQIGIGMKYHANLLIDVTALKTGISRDVTGVITVTTMSDGRKSVWHYKSYDRDVRTFNPGDSLVVHR